MGTTNCTKRERGVQIDREVVQPISPWHFHDRDGPAVPNGDGRVVDEDVDAAEPVDCGLHQALEVVLLRQVCRNRDCFGAEGLDLGDRSAERPSHLTARVHRACSDRDVGTAACERQCRSSADPTAGPSDDRDLAGKVLLCLAFPERPQGRDLRGFLDLFSDVRHSATLSLNLDSD